MVQNVELQKDNTFRRCVPEIRMLCWICGHTRRDRIKTDDIWEKLGVTSIQEKLIQQYLRWFGYIHRRLPKAPIRIIILSRSENIRKDRGRPRLT
jgi:hypothetical protein